MDANILVSGLRSTKGASFQVLRGVRAGLVRPVVSVPLFLEYEEVLLRPGLLPSHMLGQAFASRIPCIAPFENWRMRIRFPSTSL
jgi:predicted nucleic acid-binding protein